MDCEKIGRLIYEVTKERGFTSFSLQTESMSVIKRIKMGTWHGVPGYIFITALL